jgi:hypothetical protein
MLGRFSGVDRAALAFGNDRLTSLVLWFRRHIGPLLGDAADVRDPPPVNAHFPEVLFHQIDP